MKFGVREICDVVFKSLQKGRVGNLDVEKGQPVLYIDSAKTSTVEGAATTVYATGGRGNSRLIAWEGEKTLTFTVEDALLSPIGFAMLSGAGLFNPKAAEVAYVHTTSVADVIDGSVEIILDGKETLAENAPIFVMEYNDGSIGSILKANYTFVEGDETKDSTLTLELKKADGNAVDETLKQVFVDFYVQKDTVTELTIDAENFAGYYYVEASTLFRRESDGKDLPAEIVFPKVKIQSNFTFSMASSGDPSTFTFTMDALPAYTIFNKKRKALCAIQIINDNISGTVASPVTIGEKDLEVEDNSGTTEKTGA